MAGKGKRAGGSRGEEHSHTTLGNERGRGVRGSGGGEGRYLTRASDSGQTLPLPPPPRVPSFLGCLESHRLETEEEREKGGGGSVVVHRGKGVNGESVLWCFVSSSRQLRRKALPSKNDSKSEELCSPFNEGTSNQQRSTKHSALLAF